MYRLISRGHARLSGVCRSPHAQVCESQARHSLGIEKISSVQQDWIFQSPLYFLEVKLPELLPIGQDDEGVRAIRHFIFILANFTSCPAKIGLEFAIAAGSYATIEHPSDTKD